MLIFILSFITISIITGFYFIFLHGQLPKESDFNIDFEIVRNLAGENKEEFPLNINILTIATGELPNWIVAAGNLKSPPSLIEFPSFQLVYKDKTAVVEIPFNKQLFDQCPYGKDFYQHNYEIMQKALLKADFILCTHEHWDHLGGVAQSKNLDTLLNKAIFTNEQINGPTIKDAGFPKHSFDKYKPLVYDKYHCVSPGVVLIKAPGHSVGHQFVYVRLQNDQEFLFTGDVVWVNKSLKKMKNRPWIVSRVRPENRTQIANQIRYLYDTFYINKEQTIYYLTTHDPHQHKEYIEKGLLKEGFSI